MRTVCVCAAVVMCFAGQSGAGVSLYKQGVIAGEGFSSTYDPTAVFAFLAADNFSLTSGSTIEQVRWWGNGDDFGLDDLANFTQFRVTLHNRLGNGLPGAVIYQESFATAATSPVDTGLLSFNGSRVWEQTVTLSVPQALAAGSYMISIGPSGYVDNQGSIWFWNAGMNGDGFLAFDAYDGGGFRQFTQQPIDVAFELIGVPSPGSAAVAGLAMLAGLRRRR